MGLRHRSIRLRVGLLIAVPVLCLLALYAFVAGTSLGSAITQEHARSLKNDLADPVTAVQMQLALERHYAVLSLANPTDTQVASALGVQESKTQHALNALDTALHSPSVTSYAAAPEKAAISQFLTVTSIASTGNLSAIRGRVADDALSIRDALAEYDAVINAGYAVIDEALDQQSNVPLVTQALDVINLDRAAQTAGAEADLLAADMMQGKFPDGDRLAFATLAQQRQSIITDTVPTLTAPYNTLMSTHVPPSLAGAMTTTETTVIDTPWRHGAPPANVAAAESTFAGYIKNFSTALSLSGDRLENQASHNADTILVELILAAGLGLLGTILSIGLSLVIGRGLIRQLRELRESALTLAHDKLPGVITRLRAGDAVDLAEYAPGEAHSGNEIDQLQQAFAVVQQTALQSAVDEARLRRGISDVFRNLAGRSQSLLHRQLTLLDGMERRATEPDELEDLFRIDHLTTRMRRHAEGLIILSGEAPARGWRQPVPLVDVLRAAVAEVEDYTRIRVLCRTSAAVAGHAVADVIHLIAELAENATVFSPPNTPVRIQGDVVGRGFAIEIEDRGLGISAARLEEINANLASPPQFDLSGSDRLGLFIAGQLAQRHEIKITLRPSVYGGTTAIVLIPTALVVDEGTFERDPELAAVQDGVLAEGLSGRHAALAGSVGRPGVNGFANALEVGSAGANGFGAGAVSNGLGGADLGSADLGRADFGSAGLGGADFGGGRGGSITGAGLGSGFGAPDFSQRAGSSNGGIAPDPTIIAGSVTESSAAPGLPADDATSVADGATTEAAAAPGHASVAGAGFSLPEPDPESDYVRRGFSLGRRTARLEGAAGAGNPFVKPADRPASAPGSRDPIPPPPAASEPSNARVSPDEVSELGLPVRVRQASIAPQLRNAPPPPPAGENGFSGSGLAARNPGASGASPARMPRSGSLPAAPHGASPDSVHVQPPAASAPVAPPPSDSPAAASPTGATPASPEAARNIMSALQRGWQLGRSEADSADSVDFNVFAPRKSPSGQAFGPYEPDAGSTSSDEADGADEHGGE